VARSDYPQALHFLADLGLDAEISDDLVVKVRTTPSPEVLGADRGMRAGMLATVVDVVGGILGARVLAPDWMATADLALQVVAPAVGPVVEATGGVVRRGRTTLVMEARIDNIDPAHPADRAGHRSPVGFATMTFSVLPARADSPVAIRDSAGTSATPSAFAIAGDGFAQPVAEAVGMRVEDAPSGRVALPIVPYVHNSIGALQGGIIALMAEEAGIQAVASHDGADPTRLAVVDLQIAYLALARVGPAATRTNVLLGDPGGVGVQGGRGEAVVEVVDDGSEGRLVSVAHVGVVAVPDGEVS
jgi:acyl-coenzyme A thioesterase PaaI-like protein